MDINAYYKSLSDELTALKDRIRHLMTDPHWQTDGEWKESVLKSILRRHLPSTVNVGSGFIITPDSNSTQIDIIVYDNSTPVLFQDGDLVFLPPIGIKAIIEVKSKVHSAAQLTDNLSKLADNAQFLHTSNAWNIGGQIPFIGLFSYECHSNISPESLGNSLLQASNPKQEYNPRVVNHVVLSDSIFSKFWANDPQDTRVDSTHKSWHVYNVTEKAFGYFIQNVVDSIASREVAQAPEIWFPSEGKEQSITHRQRLDRE